MGKIIYYNGEFRPLAQKLRKEMTRQERHLWYDFLKGLPVTFNRQKVLGRYIVDFYCAKAKLAVELDGSQHYEPEGKASDSKRDTWLAEQGVRILRLSNLDVNRNFDGVCEEILKHMEERS